jgi:hypothetical protein
VIKVFLSAALLCGLAAPVYAASKPQHTWYQVNFATGKCKPSKLTPEKLYQMGSTTPLFNSKATCDQYVKANNVTVAQAPKLRS